MQRIRKGDTVEVTAGKNKGQRGAVIRMFVKEDRIMVEQVNIVKRHQKPRQGPGGRVQQGILEREAPIHISNVMLVCQQCDKKTRVGYRFNDEQKKVRFCKQCDQDID